MVRISLACAIVGDCTFGVRIDDGMTVADLKNEIKKMNRNTIQCDAKDLQLFLAKKKTTKTDDTWLNGPDVEALKLKMAADSVVPVLFDDHRNRHEFVRMDPLLWIKNKDHFGPKFQAGEGEVHVLVVLSEVATSAEITQTAKLSALAMKLKQCDLSGKLPQQGEFLELFDWTDGDCGKVIGIERIHDIVYFTGSKFYVRKEILCVLENFMNVYRDEFDHDQVVNKQFILMGSPGTGKSCILALICFYIAVHYKRPVVWHRKVGCGRDPPTTRLFYKDKYYEWEDVHGKVFESLYDAMKASGIDPLKCWFCLDGMFRDEIKEKYWHNMYKLLAMSGQFSPGSEAMQFTERCLKSDVDACYFVSGGNLKYFLADNSKEIIKDAVAKCAGPRDANTKHYVDTNNWRGCVTSKFALQRLSTMLKPRFFEKLMKIAKELNDDRLEDVAFEGYFHSLVRHQKSIRVRYHKYDDVDRTKLENWETIMGMEDLDEVKATSLAKCTGGSRRECVEVMEGWAADPASMDYWIPATSLGGTIAAVARWTLADGVERFCFLQLTKATTHKCDAAIIWELAQPFAKKQLPVCYIVLLPDEDKRRRFRLKLISQQTVFDHFGQYVAHFQVMSQNDEQQHSK